MAVPINQQSQRHSQRGPTTGGDHTYILDSSELKCWGKNDYGQLGHDSQGANHVTGDSPGEMAGLVR